MFDRLFGKSAPKRAFFVENHKDSLSPKQFAYWSVKWAVDSTLDTVKKMSEVPENRSDETLQYRVSRNSTPAHYHLISYSLGAYHVYSAAILGVPNDVVDEMFIGYEEGIRTLNTNGISFSHEYVYSMLNRIRAYSQEIYTELRSPQLDPEILRAYLSPSADKVFREIARAYDPQGILNIDTFDNMTFQYLIASHGMPLLSCLKDELKVTYSF